MDKIIGNKGVFAIEFVFSKEKDGFHNAQSRIWLQNKFIGDFENESPIYGVYHFLNYLVSNSNKFTTNEFKGKSKEVIYKTMLPYENKEDYFNLPSNIKDGLSSYDRFIGGFNEAYDEFVNRIYVEDDKVCFIWKLYPSDYSIAKNKYLEYDRGIHFCKVEISEVKSVLDKFKEVLITEGVLKS